MPPGVVLTPKPVDTTLPELIVTPGRGVSWPFEVENPKRFAVVAVSCAITRRLPSAVMTELAPVIDEVTVLPM